MKKLAILTALTMLLGSMSIALPASAAETTQDLGAGWTMSVPEGVTVNDNRYVKITDKKSHSGKYSLYWNLPYANTDGKQIIIKHTAQPTTIYSSSWDENNKWRVEFYVRSDGFDWYNDTEFKNRNKIGTFDCGESNVNGTLISFGNSKITWSEPDENGWRKGSFDFIYPYNWEKPDFTLRLGGCGDGMYIDDISVKRISEGLNTVTLLADGGFEIAEATGESLSDYGWSVSYNQGHIADNHAPKAEIVEVKGNKMMYVTAPDPGNGWQKEIMLKKDIATNLTDIGWGNYQIKFKIRGAYSGGHIELGCGAYDNLMHFLRETETNIIDKKELDDGWTEYTFLAWGENQSNDWPTNGFRLNVYGYSGGFYLDDFQVQKVTSVTRDSETNAITGVEVSGADHLYNGNFDNEKTNSNAEASGWNKVVSSVGDNRYITTRSNKYAYTGENSMFISAPGSWVDQKYIQFNRTIPSDFDASKEATLTLKMRTVNPDTALYCYYGNNSTNTQLASKIVFNTTAATVESLGNDWYKYTVKMPALAEGTQPYKLAIEAMSGVDGIWIDDISLIDANGKEAIENGSFETYDKCVIGEAYMMDADGEDLNALAKGENTVYVPVKTNDAGLNYNLYFVIYKNGAIYKVESGSYKNAAVGDKELSAMIKLDTVDDGTYTARAFLWDDDMVPYTNSINF